VNDIILHHIISGVNKNIPFTSSGKVNTGASLWYNNLSRNYIEQERKDRKERTGKKGQERCIRQGKQDMTK
jgi:hypothetical protein